MPDTILQVSDPADGPEAPTQDMIRGALVESRHRWQHLLGLAVDLAFETDADGRLSSLCRKPRWAGPATR
jgi:hypothetical protein